MRGVGPHCPRIEGGRSQEGLTGILAELSQPPFYLQILSLLIVAFGSTIKRILGSNIMTKIPNIIPITDLRQAASSVLKRVKFSRQPVVITQRGRAAAVVVSMEAYEKSQKEMEILRLLARGEKEIETGKGYDLSQVLADADALLE
jgi:prevent-host-death family protein